MNEKGATRRDVAEGREGQVSRSYPAAAIGPAEEPRARKPLIVQSDLTILAETDSPLYPEAREKLCRFAELVKSPEHIHTYRITPLSLWNAAASELKAGEMRRTLRDYSRYPVPATVFSEIDRLTGRYGQIVLGRSSMPGRLRLETATDLLAERIKGDAKIGPILQPTEASTRFEISAGERGLIKQVLTKIGYPVVDTAGYVSGAPCPTRLRRKTLSGENFSPRRYQNEAAEAFYRGGSARGGSGVIVLPCGSGKTVVGLAVMAAAGSQTLIVTTSVAAAHQWIREILDKTDLTPEQVGEYTGRAKDIRPVTVATYHILVYSKAGGDFEHFRLFDAADWGLIIYDEVHLLPAPLFRLTAEIQSRRRLGLTATLVREDRNEDDVFSLVGPKRYEVPWKELESRGWIAEAACSELRVPMPEARILPYAQANRRTKFRMASENPNKLAVVEDLLKRHPGQPTLIIGQYLDQLEEIAAFLSLPLITGLTPNAKRERLYGEFRTGRISVLVLSKVGNFSIDLPDARVLIQISGTFGSRQEEAQRLGRILRPKSDRAGASFYTLTTLDTVEQDFAQHRQLFLIEQGYRYEIENYSVAELREIERTESPDPHAESRISKKIV